MAKPRAGNVTPISPKQNARKAAAAAKGAKPSARKAGTTRSRGEVRERPITATCIVCGGVGDDHMAGCTYQVCAECAMHAGNHTSTCSLAPGYVAPNRKASRAMAKVLRDDPAPKTVAGEEPRADSPDPDEVEAANERGAETDAINQDEMAHRLGTVDDEIEDRHERDGDGDDEIDGDESESKPIDRKRRKPPGHVDDSHWRALDDAIRSRELKGYKQPLSVGVMCGRIDVDFEGEFGCTMLATHQIVDEKKCGECGKMGGKVRMRFCGPDAALYAARELRSPQLVMVL